MKTICIPNLIFTKAMHIQKQKKYGPYLDSFFNNLMYSLKNVTILHLTIQSFQQGSVNIIGNCLLREKLFFGNHECNKNCFV